MSQSEKREAPGEQPEEQPEAPAGDEEVQAAAVPELTNEDAVQEMTDWYDSITIDRTATREQALAYQDPGADPAEV